MFRRGGGASRLTWRRLQVLVDGLPPESASKTACRDDLDPAELAELAKNTRVEGHGPWSHEAMLMGAVLDRLGWVIHAVYRAQGGKPKEPEPYPRPGVTPPRRDREATAIEAEIVEYMRTHQGAYPPWLLNDGGPPPT